MIEEIIEVLRGRLMTETEITTELVKRGVDIKPIFHHPSGYYWSPRVTEMLHILVVSGVVEKKIIDGKIVYGLAWDNH